MDHQTIVAITAIAGASTWPGAVVLVWRALRSPIGQELLQVLLVEAWMLSLTVHRVDRGRRQAILLAAAEQALTRADQKIALGEANDPPTRRRSRRAAEHSTASGARSA
jgi:hypothetical protein